VVDVLTGEVNVVVEVGGVVVVVTGHAAPLRQHRRQFWNEIAQASRPE
jgi:hypothetical protein